MDSTDISLLQSYFKDFVKVAQSASVIYGEARDKGLHFFNIAKDPAFEKKLANIKELLHVSEVKIMKIVEAIAIKRGIVKPNGSVDEAALKRLLTEIENNPEIISSENKAVIDKFHADRKEYDSRGRKHFDDDFNRTNEEIEEVRRQMRASRDLG